MPTPLSRTSMRNASPSRAQRSSTRPCGVYLIAFETQVAQHLADQRGIRMRAFGLRVDGEREALAGGQAAELAAHVVEQRGDVEIRGLGATAPGFELADVEQRVEQPRHRVDGAVPAAR